MKNLPKGMIPNRDNMLYFDTEKWQMYMLTWEDGGNRDIPTRHYITLKNLRPNKKVDMTDDIDKFFKSIES